MLLTKTKINWLWVAVFGYFFQASIMAPTYGQFNHWMIGEVSNGLQRLPSMGRRQQQAINEWSARKWGDVSDIPAEGCQTTPDPDAGEITLEQYTALKQAENPDYGDVQRSLGEDHACTTISGAHRYLPDWREGALDITYPSITGFQAQLNWSNPDASPNAGVGAP